MRSSGWAVVPQGRPPCEEDVSPLWATSASRKPPPQMLPLRHPDLRRPALEPEKAGLLPVPICGTRPAVRYSVSALPPCAGVRSLYSVLIYLISWCAPEGVGLVVTGSLHCPGISKGPSPNMLTTNRRLLRHWPLVTLQLWSNRAARPTSGTRGIIWEHRSGEVGSTRGPALLPLLGAKLPRAVLGTENDTWAARPLLGGSRMWGPSLLTA